MQRGPFQLSIVILVVGTAFLGSLETAIPKGGLQGTRSQLFLSPMRIDATPLEGESWLNGTEMGDPQRDDLGDLDLGIEEPDPELDAIIEVGRRNLEWVRVVNRLRDRHQRLVLSSKQSQPANSMESPRRYNRATILEEYQVALSQMDPIQKENLLSSNLLPGALPIEDGTFLEGVKKIHRVYERATRWKFLSGEMDYLAERRRHDIRGYYYLNSEPDLAEKLKSLTLVRPEKRDELLQWLVQLCFSSRANETLCANELDDLVRGSRDLNEYFRQYVEVSKNLYRSFFTIGSPLPEVRWSQSGSLELLTVHFRHSGSPEIDEFLKVNVEDEWRGAGWAVKIEYVDSEDEKLPRVEFQPGVVPHVEGKYRNRIIMDANTSLDEYDTQWTIRHEFGHILGFPDCYLEYFDSEQGMMVYYQIDTNNIMCSRRGQLQPTHFEELQQAYPR